jgi:hypothetical protein
MHRFAFGLVALLAACTQTILDEAISVCDPLCRCIDSPLPTQRRECTASCTTQFEQDPLGEQCVACVIEHANRCTTLIDDCGPVCVQVTPLPAYGTTAMSSESRITR